MSVTAIIPARWGSTRFPGKPLAPICGKPLIQHTFETTAAHPHIERTVVATDDRRIAEAVEGFGGEVIITPSCPTGSDRVAAAADLLRLEGTIVNVQGDWPYLSPEAITATLELNAPMATAIFSIDDPSSPTLVKCVHSGSQALYFSRSPLPHGGPYFGHLGLYVYSSDFLRTYASLPATELQLSEDLEQLKCLEHGFPIAVAIVDSAPYSVDTPSDIAKVEEMLCNQNLSSSPVELSVRLEKDSQAPA